MLIKIFDSSVPEVTFQEANKVDIVGDVDNEGDAATEIRIDNAILRPGLAPLVVTLYGPNFTRTFRLPTGPFKPNPHQR